MTFAEAAMIMMSGEGSKVIQSLTVTANGTYTAPEGVDGYDPVYVKVPDKYDDGYNDGFSKAMDIISGNASDEEVTVSDGTYTFPDGAVTGLDPSQMSVIAKSLVAATGTAYITDTVHGKLIEYGQEYRSESNDWRFFVYLYDAKTGDRINSDTGSVGDNWGGGTDDLRVSNVTFTSGYYAVITVYWHKYNTKPGYVSDFNRYVRWVNDYVTPSFVVSGSAPVFTA